MNEQTERRPRRYLVTLTYPNGAKSSGHVWAYDAKDAVFQATLGLSFVSGISIEPAPETESQ
jgi:hypothetical protein